MKQIIENFIDKIYEIAKNHSILIPSIVSVFTAIVIWFLLKHI